jgi:hypothetical protein
VIVLLVVNLLCTRWLDREWDRWIAAGSGEKIEARLTKMRTGKVMRHPVRWITGGSILFVGLAALITNPVLVIVVARLVGGKPVPRGRITLASIAYAIGMSVLCCAIGFGIGEGVGPHSGGVVALGGLRSIR